MREDEVQDDYQLANVIYRLGEELRLVKRWGIEDGKEDVIAVDTAEASFAVAVTTEGDGRLSFKVLGVGFEGGGGVSKESTTEVKVTMKVMEGVNSVV